MRKLIAVLVLISIVNWFYANYTRKEKEKQIISYVVQRGETLWSIARQYESDPRELIFEIRKLNNITPIIMEGQTILIPVNQ